MALKLNIRPDIEREMNSILTKIPVRSKTDYINRAIEEYNHLMKRRSELARLKNYFKEYQEEALTILNDFAHVSCIHD